MLTEYEPSFAFQLKKKKDMTVTLLRLLYY